MLNNVPLEKKIKLLPAGSVFKYGCKEFTVQSIKIVNCKMVIRTDKQTFVKDSLQFDHFMNEMVVVDATKIVTLKPVIMNTDVVSKNQVFEAEVIRTNSNSKKISESLLAMFDMISLDATPENLKKAEVMVKISNAIVINEMANFKVISHRL